MTSAIAIEKSSNRKTGPVSTTYASQASCPITCPLFNNGCYAELGITGIHTARLNKSSEKDVGRIADEEAEAINKLSGTRPIRLHVVGDCTTNYAARVVSNAAKKFPVSWSYTHGWEKVSRTSWGKTNILASVENIDQIPKAYKRGYAFAIIVDQFKSDKKFDLGNGFSAIPCPAQTKENVTCSTCKLCWKTDWLYKNKCGIAFESHGSRKKIVSKLVQIL